MKGRDDGGDDVRWSQWWRRCKVETMVESKIEAIVETVAKWRRYCRDYGGGDAVA